MPGTRNLDKHSLLVKLLLLEENLVKAVELNGVTCWQPGLGHLNGLSMFIKVNCKEMYFNTT